MSTESIIIPMSGSAVRMPAPRAAGLTLAAAFLGWMFDGVEMGIFPLVARPALLELQAAAGAAGVADEQFAPETRGKPLPL